MIRIAAAILYVLLVHLSIHALAQEDSLVFHSDFEREQFEALLVGKADPLAMLVAACPEGDAAKLEFYQMRLQKLYATLEQKNLHKKPLPKKVKLIYEEVNKQLLHRYIEQVHFIDVFEYGSYNCVTASALYAVIFDHYNIEYVVNQVPSHVFLLVDPHDESIEIETTDPVTGLAPIPNRFKRDYINGLVAAKVISEHAATAAPLDVVFNKYYSPNHVVGFRELVAFTYSNRGVYLMEKEKYLEAHTYYEKASALYSVGWIDIMIVASVSNALVDADFTDPATWPLLHEYYALVPENEKRHEIVQNHRYLAAHFLEQKDDTALFAQMERAFFGFTSDSATHEEMQVNSYTTQASMAAIKGQTKSALDLGVKALALNPNNALAKSLVSRLLLVRLEAIADPDSAMAKLDAYAQQFPTLANEPMFKNGNVLAHLFRAVKLFDIHQTDAALAELHEAETINATVGDGVEVPAWLVAEAYGEGWRAYVRLGDFAKARWIVEQGLQIDPTNQTLHRYLEHLDNR